MSRLHRWMRLYFTSSLCQKEGDLTELTQCVFAAFLCYFQIRPAERREAAHGGQRDVPRVQAEDIAGWTDDSHASHDHRLLCHQKH